MQRLRCGATLRAEDERQDGGLALLSSSQQAGGERTADENFRDGRRGHPGEEDPSER